jgi:ketosteroid isomerase-like protein
MENHITVKRFYEALMAKDAEGMAKLYHDEARFDDPVFEGLQGEEVRNMWRMLLDRATDDFKVEVQEVEEDDRQGVARWEAWYTYSATNRKIHNKIKASFEIKDGLITYHNDCFTLWTWLGQAYGIKGLLMGWAPWVRTKLRSGARSALVKYGAKRLEAAK